MENIVKSEIVPPLIPITVNPKTAKILKLMFDELEHADSKYEHDKMSPYELKASYQTLRCELQELKREISRKKKRPDLMKKEAIQVLTMSFKFMRDVIFAEDKIE